MGTMTNGFTRLTEQFLVHIGVERGLATATVTAYESDIAKYIDWLETRGIHEPDAITKQDVEDYIAALDQAGESAPKPEDWPRFTNSTVSRSVSTR